MLGTVKWYNIRKGYGMIRSERGNDVFIHRTALPFWTIYLTPGDRVEYMPENTKKGLAAKNLKKI